MQLLITGGAGFIGSELVRQALDAGHQVTVLDDFSTGYREKLDGLDIRLVEADSAVSLDELESTGEHVFAVGAVVDVRPNLRLMDVHVLPSLREGFPNVVLEASAMGLPTVTTDATGAIDSLRDGETGVIVKTGDARGLADAIKTLVRDPGRASRYGVDARSWVMAGFQLESVVRTLLAFDERPGARSSQHLGEN